MKIREPKKFAKVFALTLGVILLAVSLLALAQRPQAVLEQTRPRRASTSGTTTTIVVKKGGNLQSAINGAQPGDTIEVEAGAVFVGPFTYPSKVGDAYVTIKSSRLAELSESSRVTPAQSHLMPKLVSPGRGEAAFQTLAGAHHFRLLGMEIMPQDASATTFALIVLGNDSTQTTFEKVPHHIQVDRSYVHAWPDQTLKRGVELNSAHTDITNSYISGFKSKGQDTQAICGWNGPGPFKIINNYLEASGENVMFGGADPRIPNLVPSDIEIRRNHFFKPPAWRGAGWTVKNLFELKNARRVVVDGNILENCWAESQGGFAVQLTVRNQDGTAPWSEVSDVQFTNNIVRHAAGGINILGSDNIYPSQRTNRITIANNLFEDIGPKWSNPGLTQKLFQSENTEALTIDHNTAFNDATALYLYGPPHTRLKFTNNLLSHGGGIVGDEVGGPPVSIARYAPNSQITGNAMVAPNYGDAEARYPSGNYFPETWAAVGFVNYQGGSGGDYRLEAMSRYKNRGTDRKDIGCDFKLLQAAQTDVSASAPTPSSTTSAR